MKQVSLMVCLATTCAVLFMMLSSLAMAQTDKDHLVTTLPGYKDGRTPLPFKSYTGYLLANQTRGHYLFYWFFEAQTNSDTAPLVFWTNGGPGCSSLGGEASEHGFLLVNADGSTLRENPYSWNRKANVLYIEQPIGVGFSYSNQTSDYGVVTDIMAASDMANAYRDFISRFPKFLGREVFLSGESYGGVYVPTTALEIIQGNQNGKAPYINLKGILVGNGVTDAEADSNSIPAMMKYHSLISIKYYEQGYAACKGDFFTNQNVPACAQFLDQSNNIMGNINPYYIYDSCPWLGITSQKAKVSFQEKKFHVLNEQGKKTDVHPLFQLYKHGGWSKRVALQANSKARVESDTPCVPNQSIAKYFKRLDVQKALGVQHGTVDPNGWDICTNVINYTQVYQTILPFYAKLLQHIRILVFTGDVDMVVNSYGTQAAIDKLQLQETSSWRTWEHETVTGTVVGGYIRKFGPGGKNGQGLTFVTIRGGGHMVPLMKPEAALTYFSKFLDGDCC